MAEIKLAANQRSQPTTEQWIPRLARFGYVIKGVTVLLIAGLALLSAFGSAHSSTTTGALYEVHHLTFGNVLLIAIALGFISYAIWNLYAAFRNPEHESKSQRIAEFGVAIFNVLFAWQAAAIALFNDKPSSADQATHWSAVVMAHPLGAVAVAVAGVGLALYGAWQIYNGVRAQLDDHLRLQGIDDGLRSAVVRIARFGLIAFGVVFLLIGVFLIRAAVQSNPAQARDFMRSLQDLLHERYGPWLLVVVAVGLVAYAVFQFVLARYRTIEVKRA